MRTLPFLVAFLLICTATPGFAQESAIPDAGLTQIAPGLWAVPSDTAPMWFTEGQYYVCSSGQWSTTVGGDAGWSPLVAQQLPESVRDGLDASRYASYGVCPGDPLPPTVSTAIGGPSVVMVAGYPRVIRVGPYFRGWRPAPVWVRPLRFPARPMVWRPWNRPTYGGGYSGGYRGGYGGGHGGGRGWGGGHGHR